MPVTSGFTPRERALAELPQGAQLIADHCGGRR
jgi:hypothetical protein